MKVIVDTREPEEYYLFLRKKYKDVTFSYDLLEEGDYVTDKVICERKTVGDLHQSIVDGRLMSQVNRISTFQDKIFVLLLSGDIQEYCNKMRYMKIDVNADMLYGAIAMVTYRYGFHVLWADNTREGLKVLMHIMKGIDAGNYLVPTRGHSDVLMSRFLGIPKNSMRELLVAHGSIIDIANAPITELIKIKGIGEARAKKIKEMLLENLK